MKEETTHAAGFIILTQSRLSVGQEEPSVLGRTNGIAVANQLNNTYC